MKRTTASGTAAAQKKKPRQHLAAVADSNWKSLQQALPPPSNKPSIRRPSKPAAATPPAAVLHHVNTPSSDVVALDCEMVGVGSSKATALARVTLVDGGTGAVLLDTHVRPATEVTDYRTRWSGVLPHHLRGAPSMETVVPVVQNVIQGKIVVGHGLKNDFDALGLPLPPRHLLRDTSLFKAFRTATSAVEKKTRPRKLKTLALEELGLVIQQGKMGHSSVEDAKAALALYLKVKEKWDRSSQQQQQ